MDIRVWNSYSCNNSSSFYLVAEFDNEKLVADVAKELKAFFLEHAKQKDELSENDADWEATTDAQAKLGEKYGFDFSEYLGWGDCELVGDEPRIGQHENRLLLYHGYCGGIDVDDYLTARGGKIAEGEDQDDSPCVAAMFHVAPGKTGAAMMKKIAAFFAQSSEKEDFDDFRNPFWDDANIPYGEVAEQVFYWSDGETGGFYMPVDVGDLDEIKKVLGSAAFSDYRLVLGDDSLRVKLRTLSMITKCAECKSSNIKFLEAGSGMPEDQIACRDCGGMFTLAAIEQLQPVTQICEDSLMRVDSVGDTLIATSRYSGGIWQRKPGAAWEKIKSSSGGLSGILALSDKKLLVCGENGTILVTTNAGKTWKTQKNPSNGRLWGFAPTPDGTIFLCGNSGVVLKCTDGKTWSKVKVPTTKDIMDIGAASDQVIYCCVGTTTHGEIYASKDGGKTWKSQHTISSALCRIIVLSEDVVIMAGDRGVILSTKDGGETWTKRASKVKGDIDGMCVGNDGRVYCMAGSTITVSGNNGVKWEPHNTGTNKKLWAITATPSGTLICAGEDGTVAHVEDVDCPLEEIVEIDDGRPGAPTVGKSFLFTGKLSTLSRSEAKTRVVELAGVSKSSVTKDLDYLVIGDEGSPLFGGGKKGSKMVAAEKLIAAGASLVIISETDFRKMKKCDAAAPEPDMKKAAAKKTTATKAPVKKAPVKKTPATKASTKISVDSSKNVAADHSTEGKSFLFTGKLSDMSRSEAKAMVKELGGVAKSSVTKDLDYLVIGDEGSPLFGGGKKGSKMVAAEKLIAAGSALKIISETDFRKLKRG